MSGAYLKALANLPEAYRNKLADMPDHILDKVTEDLDQFTKIIRTHTDSYESFELEQPIKDMLITIAVIQFYDPNYVAPPLEC